MRAATRSTGAGTASHGMRRALGGDIRDRSASSFESPRGGVPGSLPVTSAHRSPDEFGDPCLIRGGQLRQREGVWPHGAIVELRLVAETESRVPRLELRRILEEAD